MQTALSFFFALMISLATPKPLAEAVKSISSRTPIGSVLKSADWEGVPVALRENAIFSATVESARVLQRIQDRVLQMVQMRRSQMADGSKGAFFDRAKFIAELRRIAIEEGLTPVDPTLRDTLQDITSEARLGMIFDIQTQRAAGFAKWKAEQDADVLDAYPCQELVRVEGRKVHRNWRARWQAAGGKFYAGTGLDGKEGRMIARKDDGIWSVISRFGTPWPPRDFGSGVGDEDISRDEAEELGVIGRDEVVPPSDGAFTDGLQASVTGLSVKMKGALQTIFGDQVNVDGEVVKWAGNRKEAA